MRQQQQIGNSPSASDCQVVLASAPQSGARAPSRAAILPTVAARR